MLHVTLNPYLVHPKMTPRVASFRYRFLIFVSPNEATGGVISVLVFDFGGIISGPFHSNCRTKEVLRRTDRLYFL